MFSWAVEWNDFLSRRNGRGGEDESSRETQLGAKTGAVSTGSHASRADLSFTLAPSATVFNLSKSNRHVPQVLHPGCPLEAIRLVLPGRHHRQLRHAGLGGPDPSLPLLCPGPQPGPGQLRLHRAVHSRGCPEDPSPGLCARAQHLPAQWLELPGLPGGVCVLPGLHLAGQPDSSAQRQGPEATAHHHQDTTAAGAGGDAGALHTHDCGRGPAGPVLP
ncbi:hypothetical protein HaLaN_06967, partial [Haematococcus lacustris]